jgi:hypothetical protein
MQGKHLDFPVPVFENEIEKYFLSVSKFGTGNWIPKIGSRKVVREISSRKLVLEYFGKTENCLAVHINWSWLAFWWYTEFIYIIVTLSCSLSLSLSFSITKIDFFSFWTSHLNKNLSFFSSSCFREREREILIIAPEIRDKNGNYFDFPNYLVRTVREPFSREFREMAGKSWCLMQGSRFRVQILHSYFGFLQSLFNLSLSLCHTSITFSGFHNLLILHFVLFQVPEVQLKECQDLHHWFWSRSMGQRKETNTAFPG